MKISCKTTILPAIPQGETRIAIRLDDPESLTWGIYSLTFAEGESAVTIDWGDGSVETVTDTKRIVHTYPSTGTYVVRLSDTISGLACAAPATPAEFRKAYPSRIVSFVTTAQKLTQLTNYAFSYAENLTYFSCIGSGLVKLQSQVFRYCTELSGSLNLKPITSLSALTFFGCDLVTQLVFDNANYETITSLEGFATKFGASKATIRFES